MMLMMETQTHAQQGVEQRQQRQLYSMQQRLEARTGRQTEHPTKLPAEDQEEEEQQDEPEAEQRILQPLQPVLELSHVQLLDVQHASALVMWPTANYTLPEHDHDDEQVAFQLQVHYKVSYTLQVQQVSVGPPTATEPVQQLLDCMLGAVVESAWKDVLKLDEAPTEAQKVNTILDSVAFQH